MVSLTAVAASVQDLTVVERAVALVAAAADHLALPPSALPAAALGCQLDDLRQRLEQRVELSAESADDSASTAELLISVLRVQCELLDDDLCRRVKCLTEIRNALGDLRGLSPREMISAAPVVLSREFGFARTMISTVRGSVWLPQHLYIEDEKADPYSRRFLEYVHGAHIQLADAPLETELIRKRCGAFVPSPGDDKRTFKEIVNVSGCRGYIAAPITVGGRAIGMLHAAARNPTDWSRWTISTSWRPSPSVWRWRSRVRCSKRRPPNNTLKSKICARRRRTAQAVSPTCVVVVVRRRAGQRPDAHHHRDQPAVPSLTAREREIMSYVATGATNGQIARCLVISEGTVKSHLKHIARKLKTSSRAAAVAVYAGIATSGAGGQR